MQISFLRSVCFAFILATLSLISGAFAQDMPQIALQGDLWRENELSDLWTRRRMALEDGDSVRASEFVEQIVRRKDDLGILRLDNFAFALIREARNLPENQALPLLAEAERLAPGLPEIEDAKVRASLKGGFAVHHAAFAKVKALQARWADSNLSIRMTMYLLSHAGWLLLFVGIAFFFTQLVRYGQQLYHDVGEALPLANRGTILIAIVLIAAVPYFYDSTPRLLFYIAAVLFWAYQKTSERVIEFALLVVMGLSPLGFRAYDALSHGITGEGGDLYALELNPTDRQARESLDAVLVENGGDVMAHAALGLAHKRLGQLDEAISHLQTAVELARVYNNPELKSDILAHSLIRLGNAQFAMGRFEAADAAYREVAQVTKKTIFRAVASFNRGRLYLRAQKFAESRKLLAEAIASMPDFMERFGIGDVAEPQRNRFIVDLSMKDLVFATTFPPLFESTEGARALFVRHIAPLPELAAPFATVAFSIMCLLIGMIQSRLRLSQPCFRCGTPTMQVARGRPMCEMCDAIYGQHKSMERQVVFLKEEEIDRYSAIKRWGSRIAGILPGLPFMLWGHPVRGFFVMAIAIMFGMSLTSGITYQAATMSVQDSFGTGFSILGLIVLWAWMLYRAIMDKESH